MTIEAKQGKMDRRSFLRTTAAYGMMAAMPLGLGVAEAKPAKRPIRQGSGQRPNIIFCFADDWAWPHAGVYGDKVVKTPSFDRLAREGVLFNYAYISSPSCTPSRNSIICGQQFYRLDEGASLHSTLDVKHPNFMFLLRDAGYEIGHWRKAWGPGDFKAKGYTEHPCGPNGTFADFMKKRDKDKPFCFWFGTSDPHRGYVKDSGRKAGIPVDKIEVPAFFPNNDTVRGDIADYYFEVQRWDTDVANVLKQLEAAGELDNTIIVMSGDNGIPFPRCKGNLYDWGGRMPLAIRWGDKVKAGRTVTDFTSLTDLSPTFLEAAGVNVPSAMTGKSLLPLLLSGKDGRVEKERDFVVYGRERHTPAQAIPSMGGYPSRAIRTDKWLLILNLEPDRWPVGVPEGACHPMENFADCDNGPTKFNIMEDKSSKYYELCFAKRGAVELYDCDADPYQIHDLAGEAKYQKTVETLRKRLVDYLKETADPRFTGGPVLFDEYPYRAGYMEKRLAEYRAKQKGK